VDHGEPGVDPTESGEEAIGHSLKKRQKRLLLGDWGGVLFWGFSIDV